MANITTFGEFSEDEYIINAKLFTDKYDNEKNCMVKKRIKVIITKDSVKSRITLTKSRGNMSTNICFLVLDIKWIAITKKENSSRVIIKANNICPLFLSVKNRNRLICWIQDLYSNNLMVKAKRSNMKKISQSTWISIYSIPKKEFSKYADQKDSIKERYNPEERYRFDYNEITKYFKNSSRSSNLNEKDQKDSNFYIKSTKSSYNYCDTGSGELFYGGSDSFDKCNLEDEKYYQTPRKYNSEDEDVSYTLSTLRELDINYINPKNGDDSIDSLDLTDEEPSDLLADLQEVRTPKKDDFKLIKLIGTGAFGKVFLVKSQIDGKYYAMKRIRKDHIIEEDQIQFRRDHKNKKKGYLSEILVMREAQNPFLVKLDYIFENEYRIYLIMDYFPCGDLFVHMKRLRIFTEEQTKFVAAQIAIALGSLHKNKIIHRDIKPENLLLDNRGYCYITDFGLSKVMFSNDKDATTPVGTPEYSAPEIVNGEPQTYMIDWWSLGILIFEMIFAETPFYDSSRKTMDENIISGVIHWPNMDDLWLSVECMDIITKLLEVDPKKRLGSKGALQVLNHEWFRNIDMEMLMNKELDAPYIPAGDDPEDIEETIKREMKMYAAKREEFKKTTLMETTIKEGNKKAIRENKHVHKLLQ